VQVEESVVTAKALTHAIVKHWCGRLCLDALGCGGIAVRCTLALPSSLLLSARAPLQDVHRRRDAAERLQARPAQRRRLVSAAAV
jgi:hypothetical protein